MSQELKQNAAHGAPARSWKPHPAYKDSGVEWIGNVPEQGNNANVIFWTGYTGYFLSFNHIHPVILSRINKPQMNADERRLIASSHRKGREERKAQPHKYLSKYKIIRPGTRMTRIGRIYTDNLIRAHPRQPLRQLTSPTHMALAICGDPCSIVYNSTNKIRYKWHFSSITEKEAVL